MMEFLVYPLMLVGFYGLIKGADFLVDGSSSIAKRFGISDLVVGLTIVSLGTSMPEMVVTILSVVEGKPDVGVGNVLGSNISNILLILGITATIRTLNVSRSTVYSEIPFSILAAMVIGFVANTNVFKSSFTGLGIDRFEGVVVLMFLGIFFLYITTLIAEERKADKTLTGGPSYTMMSLPKSIGLILAGMALLFVGGKWVVDGAIALAKLMQMSEAFISLTIIAIGTSLPELMTSIVAAKKGNADVAIGNVVGSNIINLLWILGLSSVILPTPMNVISNQDIYVVVLASLMLLIFMGISKRHAILRWHGVFLIAMYVLYTLFLIFRE
ncbi:MAG: calcium/sodium antiporter [Saprospiraceae bacterium]|nr:calcium/sodium antiporter [Saprospiraceae bacterium]